MNSHLYHIQVNIDFVNSDFYKNLMDFLGWKVIFETDKVFGYKSEKSGDIWFCKSIKNEKGDYDKTGVNHVSIRVEKQEDIDNLVKYLNKFKVKTLFNTPRHRAEFVSDESETYYQVMFTSPDNILFEIVYIGTKK